MKTIRLGKTGLEVSRIGMGGIPITRPPEDEAIKVIQRALDLGVNFIDTAFAYHGSEERIGKALVGRRYQVIVATKTTGRDKVTALEQLETSLKRLNSRYVDLWQLHGLNTLEDYETILRSGGAMEAAQAALRSGKIRHIGASGHSLNVAIKMVTSGLFEAIQFPFNFVNNEAADELIPLAEEDDVGFIAMKPFAGGRLKDANLVIRYLLQFDNVVPDPGIKKAEEIEEIVRIVNDNSVGLTQAEEQKIQEIRAALGTRFCQWCGYCQPCQQEVDIPWLMNARSYDSYGESFKLGVARAVETAKNCIQCGECEKKCPYGLPIMKTIAENIEFYKNIAGV
jgi:predicted aldo/keto reductase-like oxidoreductase